MIGTKHDQKLVKDRDFIVIDETVPVSTPSGVRHTKRLWKVWLIQEDIETCICATCFQFTGPPRTVTAHLGAHSRTKKNNLVSAYRKARAFDLLPKKIQQQLLARLDQQGEPS